MLVEEEYHYSQEISANRWTERGDAPSGHIDIRAPYDGVRHLPRSTAKALARRLDGITDESEATIGHVLVADHQHTDLGDHLDLDRNSRGHLRADSRAVALAHRRRRAQLRSPRV